MEDVIEVDPRDEHAVLPLLVHLQPIAMADVKPRVQWLKAVHVAGVVPGEVIV